MRRTIGAAMLAATLLGGTALAQQAPDERLTMLKKEAVAGVEARAKLSQEMVDSVFSFGELAFQEFETSAYLTRILEENGFTVERGIAGLPTGWTARWGSGGPVLALGSDIDGIPKASQKPGVARKEPTVEGAPGHGEGHNSGVPLNIVAALALKDVMEREKIPGTLMLWPGVAEELLAGKAYMVRDGVFEGVDAVLFTHVADAFAVNWGQANGTGMVSVEYSFDGSSAHSASRPWAGKSALDAVELMNIGWNFRREHLRPEQRSHYVIRDGGDQPNVVPSKASVWYFIREIEYDGILQNFGIADTMAQAAAMMTDTTMSKRIIGTAWPRHFNRPIAEATQQNIQAVGMPAWSDADQRLAKATQKLVGGDQDGLKTKIDELKPPPEKPESGGSDDIGDVSWVVPTVTLRYPSNIPNLPGHHWSNAISMATPLAHKGVQAGSKVLAMTALDLLTKPELMTAAKDYFTNVQTKDTKYQPFIAADDKPQTYFNTDILAEFRPRMREFYYDPGKHESYLAQLKVEYPTVDETAAR